MIMRQLRIALAFTVTLSSTSVAQGSNEPRVPTIDPSVAEVRSAGSWEVGERRGAYRVLILQSGFERVQYHAIVQWIEVDMERGPRVVASKNLNALALNCFSLVSPQFTNRAGMWYLVLKGASEPLKEATQPLEFSLGAPGKVSGKNCAPAF
jgi:hypothetical protein